VAKIKPEADEKVTKEIPVTLFVEGCSAMKPDFDSAFSGNNSDQRVLTTDEHRWTRIRSTESAATRFPEHSAPSKIGSFISAKQTGDHC
jgi:hypothetical protein